MLGQPPLQDRRVVEHDLVGDQPCALVAGCWLLVADFDVEVGTPAEFPLTANLRDGRSQWVVRLGLVLRSVHVALQLRVSQIPQGVDTANQLVVLVDCLPRRVVDADRKFWAGVNTLLAVNASSWQGLAAVF